MFLECGGKVYNVLMRDVFSGQELLVNYGEDYARRFDVDTVNYYNMNVDIALCTEILEVNLFAFAHRVFHEDFSSIDRILRYSFFFQLYIKYILVW